MKRRFLLPVAMACLVFLAGCGEGASPSGGESAPSSESPADTASASAEVPSEAPAEGPQAPDDVIAALNRVLADNGVEEVLFFHESFTCENYDNVTIYRTSGIMGIHTVVVYLKETGEYRVLDLDPYSNYDIFNIAPFSPPDPLLRITADSDVFGGDYRYKNFIAEIHYSLEEDRIVEVQYHQTPGVYGMTGSRDTQRFAGCTIEEDEAVFRFEVAPGSQGNGYAGPEILIDAHYGEDPRTVIGFRNTEQTLPEGWARQMEALPGVASVEIDYLETELFTGTQLVVRAAEGYQVACSFNRSGGVAILEDFSVGCRPM